VCGVGLTTLAEEATPQFTAGSGTHLEHWFGGECYCGHHNPFHLSPLYPSHFLPRMLQDHTFISLFVFIYYKHHHKYFYVRTSPYFFILLIYAFFYQNFCLKLMISVCACSKCVILCQECRFFLLYKQKWNMKPLWRGISLTTQI